MADLILVADNEPDILRFVEVNLRLEGFAVITAADGQEALEQAFETQPALVVLDVMMPKMDGLEVCRRLRADPRTQNVPIIILTAKALPADKVVAFTAGADDYVLKPFDPSELVARVRTTLRRSWDLRATSPLTGLPGNHQITRHLVQRLEEGEPLAVVYADLNDFKAYNDYYGFVRGDDVITLAADICQDALREHAGDDAFLGHVGGDDLMFMCHPEHVTAVCEAIIDGFDRRVQALYDPDDLDRGYIEVRDRQGEMRRFPPVSIALGVATSERRQFIDHREVIEVAGEMKSYLKQKRRYSSYAIDGRTDEAEERQELSSAGGAQV
ncbi:MAG TPA: response regulator [Egibacteraceae bacterium]|nr:response regulator [Egibacteraceae bacterium]